MDLKVQEKYKEFGILSLTKRYTVSTLLVLPLYNDNYQLIGKLKSGKLRSEQYIFSQLLIAGNLNNCFLCTFDNKYYLLIEMPIDSLNFPLKNLTDDVSIIENIETLNDLILINPHLSGVKKEVFVIKYLLRIPEEFQPDMELLIQSKYSKVSEAYKDRLKVKCKSLLTTGHDIADQLCTLQFSYFVTQKSEYLLHKIKEELKLNHLEDDIELFQAFNLNKELKC